MKAIYVQAKTVIRRKKSEKLYCFASDIIHIAKQLKKEIKHFPKMQVDIQRLKDGNIHYHW